MRALIIYDSVYKNTESIARAIGDAVGVESKVVHASDADPAEVGEIDLLIVGSPTHGGRPTPAIQEFLEGINASQLKRIKVAAFDTRYRTRVVKVFGFAANRIIDNLVAKGAAIAAPAEGFIVKGKKGPIMEGELERARVWGEGLSRKA